MSSDRLTEVLNYLSAISREIGALRTEMQTRFDQVETRIDQLEAEMRANFETVRADVRHLARKVELMNQDLLDLRADQRDLEVRMDTLESKRA